MENRGDTGEQPDHLLAFLFLFFFALARIFKQIISFYLVEIGISLQVKDNLACKGRTLRKILSYTRKGKSASLVAQMRICLQCRRCKRHWFDPWVGKIPWRREWQPTPVFLPGKFNGQRSLAGYSPWRHKDSDTTEWLTLSHFPIQIPFDSSLLFRWKHSFIC